MKLLLLNKKLFFLLFASYWMSAVAQTGIPSDPKATQETVALYKNLSVLKEKGFMFGHQDDQAYGVNWRYEKDRSDVKETAGDYPAVYGYDLCGLELNDDKNIDGVPFKKMKGYIQEAYNRGGVVTLSWHFKSPFGKEKGAWDTTHGTVASILPGGVNHELFKSWLDAGSNFISKLKGKNGEAIPVLFRPFHEFTGSWFWWGYRECTPQEYITIYRFVVYYLQQQKGLHNLIYVYNTGGDFKTKEEYLERYPGDDIVDVLSFDAYQYGDPLTNNWFVTNTNNLLKMIGEIGAEKNKPTALAETGYEAIPYAEWWNQTLLKAIGDNKISYVLLWRNHGLNKYNNPPNMHYYVPFKGQVSENDFKKFYELKNTLFEKEVSAMNVYKLPEVKEAK